MKTAGFSAEIAPSDENAWREAGRRQFEAAYAAEDSIYEQLINDASSG